MKKNIKIPIRTCIGCQNKKPKREMLRIIRTSEGNIEIDATGKKSGRGAYLCYNVECLDKALREKRLYKSFKKDISPQIINELRKKLFVK
ncbi:MAG: YlxR family protein [Atribacterota bacterium]